MALSKQVVGLRKQFRDTFSSQTANIIKRIAKGHSSVRIASTLGVSVGTVGTTKGNLTRGLYAPFAVVDGSLVTGTCLFAS